MRTSAASGTWRGVTSSSTQEEATDSCSRRMRDQWSSAASLNATRPATPASEASS
jgi:hypothetical protein